VSDIVHRPIEQVEQDMKQGASPASFVSDHLREGGSDEGIRQQLPWVAWSLYEGTFLLDRPKRGMTSLSDCKLEMTQ
jgi:hypothetical protein